MVETYIPAFPNIEQAESQKIGSGTVPAMLAAGYEASRCDNTAEEIARSYAEGGWITVKAGATAEDGSTPLLANEGTFNPDPVSKILCYRGDALLVRRVDVGDLLRSKAKAKALKDFRGRDPRAVGAEAMDTLPAAFGESEHVLPLVDEVNDPADALRPARVRIGKRTA